MYSWGGSVQPAAGAPGAPGADGLRPLGVGETLDTAIKLYRNNAVALWKVVAIIIVPLQVIDVIVRRVTLPSDVFLPERNALHVLREAPARARRSR